jgi:hypothetical protein
MQVLQVPGALLRVLGEGSMVQGDPRLVVDPGDEGAQADPGRELDRGQRCMQGTPHLPQRPAALEAQDWAHWPAAACSPCAHIRSRRPWAASIIALNQAPAHALTSMRRVDDHLGTGPGDLVGHVQVAVADQVPEVVHGEEVLTVLIPAVPKVQPGVLGEGMHPIRPRDPLDEVRHVAHLVLAEVLDPLQVDRGGGVHCARQPEPRSRSA